MKKIFEIIDNESSGWRIMINYPLLFPFGGVSKPVICFTTPDLMEELTAVEFSSSHEIDSLIISLTKVRDRMSELEKQDSDNEGIHQRQGPVL